MVSKENLSAANSRIRDADIAEETTELTKNQILMQSGIAVLGQANTTIKTALSLLGLGRAGMRITEPGVGMNRTHSAPEFKMPERRPVKPERDDRGDRIAQKV